MIFTPLSLAGAYRIELQEIDDERGCFARCYCEREFGEMGLATHWVQANMSLSLEKGTIRGLHFQRQPMAEERVVRCVQGAIWDVIADLRLGSATFGQWCATELTSVNRRMVYVPKGFAHGFQTLEPDTELLYFHSEFYSPEHQAGLYFGDEELGIQWPLPPVKVSPRDRAHPSLNEIEPIVP